MDIFKHAAVFGGFQFESLVNVFVLDSVITSLHASKNSSPLAEKSEEQESDSFCCKQSDDCSDCFCFCSIKVLGSGLTIESCEPFIDSCLFILFKDHYEQKKLLHYF
ncbi:hypothetical protein NH340_JMT04151 [Sarcoptes scabiei]|nr:hypothetical protein NH340_JMT04151 [Sarcoptes scabiei]